jgi:hypothetical protein
MRRSRTLVAATLLLVACERSESPRSGWTGSSVPLAVPSDQTPALESALSAELRAALAQLLRGPSAPAQSADTLSWFSAETAGALRSATVDSIGHATVDFRDLQSLIPNASSSAGSALLLDELNSTVFEIEGIRSVEYRIDGSCDRFWEWLQYGCHTVTREETESRLNR